MADPGSDEFDPNAREHREVGRDMAGADTGLGPLLGNAYRGELDEATTWRQRLDQATTWAVTVVAGILTWAFSNPDTPHYVLLGALVILAVFLGIEARRYRAYDVYRSRVRLLEQNLIATALDPSEGVEHRHWRAELSQDYRRPTLKVSYGEALANRLRRVYLALFGIVLAAWLVRLAAFSPGESLLAAAVIGSVPGVAVVGIVGCVAAAALAIAFWPRERQAKGEFREGDPETWKEDDGD